MGPNRRREPGLRPCPAGETKPIERGCDLLAQPSPGRHEEARRALPRRRERSRSGELDAPAAYRAADEAAEARRIPAATARLRRYDLDRGDGLGETFHALEPAFTVADALHGARELQHRLDREHLAGSGERAQSRREVERAAPVSARDRHRLAGIESDADAARQVGRGNFAPGARGPIEAPAARNRRRRAPRRRAARSPSVALLDHAADDVRERRRELRGRFVAVLDVYSCSR